MARRKQETLVLFPDVYMSAGKLTDAQFGALMRAAFSYRFEDIPYTGEDILVELMFGIIKTQLDRYKQVCETNRVNATATVEEDPLGSEMQRNAAESSEMQRNAAECSEMQRNTPHNHTHTRNHNHNHNHNQGHNPNHTPGEGEMRSEDERPPYYAEIEAYCYEHDLVVIPIDFWKYYREKNWKDENGDPIKNWRAVLHSWDEKQREAGLLPYTFYG